MFDQAKCTHMESIASDHSMLVLDTTPQGRKNKKRFVFDKRWTKREGISDVIKEGWNERVVGSRMFRVTSKVKKCRVALLKWRNNFIDHSKKAISQLKVQLEKEKSSESEGRSGRLARLKQQLSRAYKDEEQYWS